MDQARRELPALAAIPLDVWRQLMCYVRGCGDPPPILSAHDATLIIPDLLLPSKRQRAADYYIALRYDKADRRMSTTDYLLGGGGGGRSASKRPPFELSGYEAGVITLHWIRWICDICLSVYGGSHAYDSVTKSWSCSAVQKLGAGHILHCSACCEAGLCMALARIKPMLDELGNLKGSERMTPECLAVAHDFFAAWCIRSLPCIGLFPHGTDAILIRWSDRCTGILHEDGSLRLRGQGDTFKHPDDYMDPSVVPFEVNTLEERVYRPPLDTQLADIIRFVRQPAWQYGMASWPTRT